MSKRLLILVGVCLVFLSEACRPTETAQVLSPQLSASSYTNDVALKWSNMHLWLVRNGTGFTPPVAARSFGYAGVAMYEAVVPGMPDNMSLVRQLQGLTALPQPIPKQTYNWALSANAAQSVILRGLFANASSATITRIDSLEQAIYGQVKTTDDAQNMRSAAFGKEIGYAVFEWSKTDGGHEGYNRNFPATYVPVTGPGLWQPTENGLLIPMQPTWGNNRTMLATTQAMTMPAPLPIATQVTSTYFAQYLEVYTKNKSLTQEEKEIAVWWSDDPKDTFTPPGHSYNIARIAVASANADLGKAAESLARVGIAVSDAFVRCWKCKFVYNNERPYTYIRRTVDPGWVPFWPAPPFPGFPSGHSTQSAAMATVLTDLYGYSFSLIDNTHTGRARDAGRNTDFKTRYYRSFWETAEESGWSRILGGIHTRQDNDTGLKEGRTIGQNINELRWKR